MKHTISVLVENRFGVLAHVSGLFSARGFNIDSLTVGETQDPTVSRMTIVVKGDDKTLEQVIKQLHKLIDVITVFDLRKKDFVDREVILVKVEINEQSRNDALKVLETQGGKVAHADQNNLIVEIVGDREKIDSSLELLKPFGIKELVRSGKIAMAK